MERDPHTALATGVVAIPRALTGGTGCRDLSLLELHAGELCQLLLGDQVTGLDARGRSSGGGCGRRGGGGGRAGGGGGGGGGGRRTPPPLLLSPPPSRG